MKKQVNKTNSQNGNMTAYRLYKRLLVVMLVFSAILVILAATMGSATSDAITIISDAQWSPDEAIMTEYFNLFIANVVVFGIVFLTWVGLGVTLIVKAKTVKDKTKPLSALLTWIIVPAVVLVLYIVTIALSVPLLQDLQAGPAEWLEGSRDNALAILYAIYISFDAVVWAGMAWSLALCIIKIVKLKKQKNKKAE